MSQCYSHTSVPYYFVGDTVFPVYHPQQKALSIPQQQMAHRQRRTPQTASQALAPVNFPALATCKPRLTSQPFAGQHALLPMQDRVQYFS